MGDVLLSLDAVSKSYWRGATEVRVLDGASLEVPAGELVAVWGKRGAGKTTLLRIAAGLERADDGSVSFDGDDLSSLSEGDHARLMREQLAWVRRAGPSSDLAMVDYVALPLLIEHGQRRARRRASDALHRVGMSECAGQRWGVDHWVGWRGQPRRVRGWWRRICRPASAEEALADEGAGHEAPVERLSVAVLRIALGVHYRSGLSPRLP